MKKTLTIFGLLLTTLMFGQTSFEEFNYANNGYRLLKESGLPERTDLSFVEDSRFEVFNDDDFVILKLVREDNSVACVFLGYESMFSYGVICDPKSSKEIKAKSRDSLRLFYSDGKIDEHKIVIELMQRLFWPE